MLHGIIHGSNDHEGVIQAIPKAKAEDLIEVIRFGMHQKELMDFTAVKKRILPHCSQVQSTRQLFNCR